MVIKEVTVTLVNKVLKEMVDIFLYVCVSALQGKNFNEKFVPMIVSLTKLRARFLLIVACAGTIFLRESQNSSIEMIGIVSTNPAYFLSI